MNMHYNIIMLHCYIHNVQHLSIMCECKNVSLRFLHHWEHYAQAHPSLSQNETRYLILVLL